MAELGPNSWRGHGLGGTPSQGQLRLFPPCRRLGARAGEERGEHPAAVLSLALEPVGAVLKLGGLGLGDGDPPTEGGGLFFGGDGTGEQAPLGLHPRLSA